MTTLRVTPWLHHLIVSCQLLPQTTQGWRSACRALRSAGITVAWCCCLALCRFWGSQFKTLPRIGKHLIHWATSSAQIHTISCGFNLKGVLKVVDGPGSVGTAPNNFFYLKCKLLGGMLCVLRGPAHATGTHRIQRTAWESPFHYVDPGAWTQVFRLADRHLYFWFVYVHLCTPEEGIRSHGSRVIDGCQPPCELRTSGRVVLWNQERYISC